MLLDAFDASKHRHASMLDYRHVWSFDLAALCAATPSAFVCLLAVGVGTSLVPLRAPPVWGQLVTCSLLLAVGMGIKRLDLRHYAGPMALFAMAYYEM